MKKKKQKFNFKENKKIIIAFISFILFTLLTYTIFSNGIDKIDHYIENIIINIRQEKLTNVMIIITNLSSAYSLIVISILLLTIIKNKKIPMLIIINLLFSFLTSQLAKVIMQRERPVNISLIDAIGFSYPSGHSLISMAYFGFIAYLLYKNKKSNKLTKIILITTLFITILTIGFSRIYLGVHYFSDVIGGFLLSCSYLMLFINLNKLLINEVIQ